MMLMRLRDPRVQAAVDSVDRADFLSPDQRPWATHDRPLDIGYGQTTSQPSLIAWMIDQLHLQPHSRALEIGTGCGYQTALLAKICRDVYSIDIVEPLVRGAGETLERLGYRNVHLRAGDGYLGWPEAAPFDGIVVGATASVVPQPLIDQLATGGRLIIPVGTEDDTELLLVTRDLEGKLSSSRVLPVRFVPLTGDMAERDRARAGRI